MSILRIAALLGALSVGIGAFGAHGLAAFLAATGRAATFETAVRYQMYHALALLGIGIWQQQRPDLKRALNRIAGSWLAGIVLFSGSLYALIFSGLTWLGAITPLGGVALIAGWLLLVGATSQRTTP